LFDTQGRRLSDEMPRSRVDFTRFEQRLEDILIQGHVHDVTKGFGRELKHVRRVAQSVFNAAQLAASNHLNPFEPKSWRKGLNVIRQRCSPDPFFCLGQSPGVF